MFGWIAVNFLAARLEGMSNTAMGTLTAAEVGGASFQLTFNRKLASSEDHGLFHVSVGGHEYTLYSHRCPSPQNSAYDQA